MRYSNRAVGGGGGLLVVLPLRAGRPPQKHYPCARSRNVADGLASSSSPAVRSSHDHRRERRDSTKPFHAQRHRRRHRPERRTRRLADPSQLTNAAVSAVQGRELRAGLGGRKQHRRTKRQRGRTSLRRGPTTSRSRTRQRMRAHRDPVSVGRRRGHRRHPGGSVTTRRDGLHARPARRRGRRSRVSTSPLSASPSTSSARNAQDRRCGRLPRPLDSRDVHDAHVGGLRVC